MICVSSSLCSPKWAVKFKFTLWETRAKIIQMILSLYGNLKRTTSNTAPVCVINITIKSLLHPLVCAGSIMELFISTAAVDTTYSGSVYLKKPNVHQQRKNFYNMRKHQLRNVNPVNTTLLNSMNAIVKGVMTSEV